MRNNATEKQVDEFKNHHIFGIEQDDEVVALALVNMIFRGDGKNNMSEGNCFQKNIEKIIKESVTTGKFDPRNNNLPQNPIITKVLMNPLCSQTRRSKRKSIYRLCFVANARRRYSFCCCSYFRYG